MPTRPSKTQELESKTGEGTFGELLASPPQPVWPEGHVLATCLDDRHPVLTGRVLVRCETALGQACQTWAPTLKGLSVRAADRVLVLKLPRELEPVVVGVLDGFGRRPDPPVHIAQVLEVKPDQVLQINAENGQGLLQIAHNQDGSVIRLLQADSHIELPGKLCLSASAIEMQARSGGVRIAAADDVKIVGETVHLN
jgi:hypothetical protein